ncbi:unnamed protein product [Sphagnum balticum]
MTQSSTPKVGAVLKRAHILTPTIKGVMTQKTIPGMLTMGALEAVAEVDVEAIMNEPEGCYEEKEREDTIRAVMAENAITDSL